MHNSIILFLLVGLLVMLIPFGSSMNIFLNALAVEMNPDMNNDDLSQRYERFYKDDNFREAYYNYHKQHHQQEQKQPTSYNNDYSYDSDSEPEYSSYKLDYKPEYNSYEKDNSYPSKDSSNVKCNNINVNLNGDIDIGASQALDALATDEAQTSNEGEIGASNLGNDGGSDGGRPTGSDSDSRFACINNNNNVVNDATDGNGNGDDGADTCVECFTKSLTEDQLEGLELALEGGIDITIGGETITIDSLLELWTELKVATPEEIIPALNAILGSLGLEIFEFAAILDCIAFALDIDVLPLQ